jgi:hypothetical protein
MEFPRFTPVAQTFPNRAISDIPNHIRQQLQSSDFVARMPQGGSLAIGVGSRGIANIDVIVKAVVEFFKEQGIKPFLFPAMGSHGSATGEGQAGVLEHYGISEQTMGAPVRSSLEVASLGRTQEGIEVFVDRNASGADGIFLVGRVKQHTDFSGEIESGLFKMMAIGLGKLAGARQYHTFAYRMGLEQVIRSVGARVLDHARMLGGLAIVEGAHHETAALTAVSSSRGTAAMIAAEAELLAMSKAWAPILPAAEIDVLIIDEMGKNISGAGMDTKVINRGINGQYNPFQHLPVVHRVYVRGLSELTYGNAVGIGLADIIHNRTLSQIDWVPTYLNALTSGPLASIRTPANFSNDFEALSTIAQTVGKTNLNDVTYCRIRNTLELTNPLVSDNLLPRLSAQAKPAGDSFELSFDIHGNLAGPVPDANHLPLSTAGHASNR